MIRFYFAVIVSILIISPHTVNAFFLLKLPDITVTRNINCRLDDNEPSTGDFQYCAIRIYDGMINTQDTTVTLYDGLRYLNTFQQFIQTSCPSFKTVLNGDLNTGTGLGNCDTPRSFETFEDLQLCICATDNCNQNINSCTDSTASNTNITTLTDFMPPLTSTIQCDNTLNTFSMCQEHPFINVSACEEYVSNNSVLCAVTMNDTKITHMSLIYENYEAFLSEIVYQVLSVSNDTTGSSFNQTETNVYNMYFMNALESVQECACTNYSLCNQNINTCLSQTPLQIETTISTPSFTSISSENSASIPIFTSEVVSITTAMSVDFTTITGSTTTSTPTDSTKTTTMSTGSTTTSTPIDSTTTTVSTGSTTTSTPTDSLMTTPFTDSLMTAVPTDSAMTTAFTNSLMTAAPTDSPMTIGPMNATTTTETPTVTLSSNGQIHVPGEQGIGSAATAGIVCGIVFTTAIIVGIIVYFKLIYPRITGHPFDRSAAYRA